MVSNPDEDDDISGSEDDEGLDEDMEALRRACILTGTHLNSHQPPPSETTASDSDDDMELLRGIQQMYSACNHAEAPLSLNPLSTLPPALSDQDDHDDFEILRAIQKRFSGYDRDGEKNGKAKLMSKVEHVHSNNIALEKETFNYLVVDSTNVSEGFQDSLDSYNTSQSSELNNNINNRGSPSSLVECHRPDDHSLALMPCRVSSFPKSAEMFVDAIKKNRACQKFLRSKLMQIEARIEENKTLKQCVKLLRDFQVSCKRRTGRALSQKKDARVQLISVIKPRANSKVKGENGSPLYYGPNENSQVPCYRMVLKKFPISLNRKKWSREERENLAKGIKQQVQKLLFQKSADLIKSAFSWSWSNIWLFNSLPITMVMKSCMHWPLSKTILTPYQCHRGVEHGKSEPFKYIKDRKRVVQVKTQLNPICVGVRSNLPIFERSEKMRTLDGRLDQACTHAGSG